MNPLMECIKQFDPFYSEPISEEKNGIYFHQQPSIKELIEIGKRPVCAYVGQTDPSRGLERFKDGDYSKLPEKVVPDIVLKVHKELSDHYIRQSLYSCGCRKTQLGGSPEVVYAPLWIKTYSEFLSFLREKVIKLSDKFYEQERVYGYTPESHAKKIKEKNPEAVRAPKLHLVCEIIDKLKTISKDAIIYVPMDSFGHFCITLSNLGYKNIYTDKDYDMNIGMGYIPDTVKFITEEDYKDMDFDAVIGNPPYGKGGRSWVIG